MMVNYVRRKKDNNNNNNNERIISTSMHTPPRRDEKEYTGAVEMWGWGPGRTLEKYSRET